MVVVVVVVVLPPLVVDDVVLVTVVADDEEWQLLEIVVFVSGALCLECLFVGCITVVVGVVSGCERMIHTRCGGVLPFACTAGKPGNDTNC